MKEELRSAGFPKQTPDQRSKIDAVLFALWAQGHLERSRASSILMMPVSWVAGSLVAIFNLPAAVFRRLPEIALAAILSGLLSKSFQGIGSVDAGAAFFLALIMLLRREILRFVRNFFFDLGDLLTFGSLSRHYANRHLAIGPLTVFDDADGLKGHLATSRVLTAGPYSEEARAFQENVARNAANRDELQAMLDRYWDNFPGKLTYWRDKLYEQSKG